MNKEGLVIVVDDDEALRGSLVSLFRSVGMDVYGLSSGRELLEFGFPERPICVVLDVRLGYVSGLEVQENLLAAGVSAGIVFITAFGDISMSVSAMKKGAIDFIVKPFRDQELLDAVFRALESDNFRRKNISDKRALAYSYDRLTDREREVMALVASGMMNRQIADQLGVALATIKVYRSNVMRKMKVRSLASLVMASANLGIIRKDDAEQFSLPR